MAFPTETGFHGLFYDLTPTQAAQGPAIWIQNRSTTCHETDRRIIISLGAIDMPTTRPSERAFVFWMLCTDVLAIAALVLTDLPRASSSEDFSLVSTLGGLVFASLVTLGIPYALSLSWVTDHPRRPDEGYGRAAVVGIIAFTATWLALLLIVECWNLEFSPVLPAIDPRITVTDRFHDARAITVNRYSKNSPYVCKQSRLMPDEWLLPFASDRADCANQLRERLPVTAALERGNDDFVAQTLEIVREYELFTDAWSLDSDLHLAAYELTAPAHCSWFGTPYGPPRRFLFCASQLFARQGWDIRDMLFDISDDGAAPPRLVCETRISSSHDAERMPGILTSLLVLLSIALNSAVALALMALFSVTSCGRMSAVGS